MSCHDRRQLRNERECGVLEFWLRRIYSSVIYYRVYRMCHPNHPYYVPGAIKFLSNVLKDKRAKVFEWGSGISTVWYAKNAEWLIAVEHNEEWYHRVTSWLQINRLKNVELKYVPPEGSSFQNYSKAILKYEDEFFDVVAVDGRNRVDCIRHAVNKVKIGGYLILDDSHRTRYQPACRLLTNYERKKYDFGLLQTTIFQRLK